MDAVIRESVSSDNQLVNEVILVVCNGRTFVSEPEQTSV